MSSSFATHAPSSEPQESSRSQTMRVMGYLRVSTTEQSDSGLGLMAQHQAIEAEAARRGWELVRVFEDAGISAKNVSGRPGLQAALTALDSGEADLLIAAKVDRLSRSVTDFSRLLQRYPKRLHVLDLGVDLASPYGEMVAHVVAAMAQLERRLAGERTKAALAVKRAQGVRLGRPREIPPAVVAHIAELRSVRLSVAGIARRLNEEGVATRRGGRWHPPGVARVLSWANAA